MKFEVYKGKGGWRWRLRAGNGRIVATAGEAYQRRADALKGVRSVSRTGPTTAVVVDGEPRAAGHIKASGALA